MKKQRKGFTTVELVIVIAVIAILATVLIPTFAGIIRKAHHNSDVQMASNLTTQIKMYLVNKDIKTESDLRDAINENMGEGFYEGIDEKAGLTPESAQYGYHFWYDIEKEEIIVASVEEIDKIIEERKQQVFAYDNILLSAAPSVPNSTWTESTAHFRHYQKDGYHFFLLDRGGSEIGKAFAKLDELNGGTNTYGDVLTVLNSLASVSGDDQALAEMAAANLEKNAVVAYGTFVKDGDTTIENVYISLRVKELSATNTRINNTANLSVTLPSNVTKVNSYSLLFARAAALYINAEEELLETMFGADCISSNCTITLPNRVDCNVKDDPNGDNAVIDKEGDRIICYLDYSAASVVADMTLSGSALTQKKIELVPNDDGSYNLYVAVDYTNTITMSVLDYLNAEDEKIVAVGTKWSVGEGSSITCTDADLGTFKITGYADDNTALAGTIIAKIQGVTKTVNVYGVKAVNVTVSLDGNEGLNIREVDQNNTVITLPYKPAEDNSFKFKPSLILNYPNADITLDDSITVDAGAMQFANNLLSLPKNSFSDNASTTLSVSYKGINSGITYTVKLINVTDQSFAVNDEYVTNGKYDLDNYYVGNDGKFALKYLFKNTKNIDGQTITVTVSKSGTVIDTFPFTDLSGLLDLSDITETGNIVIEIGVGGATTPVTVYLVAATNVTADNVSSLQGGSNKDIVLLSDIDMSSAKTLCNIYGNLHKINASTGSNKGSGYWPGFITLYGTMDNTLVIGPTYDEIKLNDHAKAWDGVRLVAANSTITNSYLYGFRAPVAIHAASDCTIKIENTTIEGGAYCNIHIASYKELILNNVDLVQDYAGYTVGSKKAYGLGVLFDDSGCKGTVTLAGNTNLYNWINKTEGAKFNTVIYSLVIVNYTTKDLLNKMVDLGTENGYIHSGYVNAGFVQVEGDNKVEWIAQDNDARGPKYTGSTYSKSGNVRLLTKSYTAWSIPSCTDTCTHTTGTFLPEGWSHQNTNHSDNYLRDREKPQS